MNIYLTIRRAGCPHRLDVSQITNIPLFIMVLPVMVVTSNHLFGDSRNYLAAAIAIAAGLNNTDALTALYFSVCQAIRKDDRPEYLRPPSRHLGTMSVITDYIGWSHNIILLPGAYAVFASGFAAKGDLWAVLTVPPAMLITWGTAYTEARWGARYIGTARGHDTTPSDPQQAAQHAQAARLSTISKAAGVGLVAIAAALLFSKVPTVYPAITGTIGFAVLAVGRIPAVRFRHAQQHTLLN